jgi:tripartite-type tricarboxylate transporter receptor subunit TctC
MDHFSKSISVLLFAAIGAGVLATPAAAQSYPTKTIRMVVPFPAGGATDIFARVMAERLAPALGQAVIVDNRPGAGGTIGSDVVAKSPGDGYTILMATSSTHAIAPGLNPKLPYNVERDFAPVSMVAITPTLLVANVATPAQTVAELIALARAKPGELTFASSGTGTAPHLAGELFKVLAKVDIRHIPYKGTQLAVPDLISGQVTILFDAFSTGIPHVRSGKLKALGVGSAKRSALLPDVPTIAEAGLPQYTSDIFFGVFAPSATPREIVARLAQELTRIVQTPDVRDRLAAQGAEPVGSTPQQFAQAIRAETEKWARVIREGGIKLE